MNTETERSYKQTRDLLFHAKDFHRRLKEFYQQIRQDVAENERVKLLLDFIKSHEEELEKTFQELEEIGQSKTLDTWIQYTPEKDVDQSFAEVEIRSNMSVDDIIEAILKLEGDLIEFYKEASELAPTSQVQECFRRLYENRVQKRRYFSVAVLELKEGM